MTQVAGDELWARMWKTMKIRFNSAERLRKRAHQSAIATGMFSFYIFVISLLSIVPLKGDKPLLDPGTYGVATAIASVFIIILTAFEYAKDYSRASERMHSCALDVHRLYNEYDASIKSGKQEREAYAKLYADVMQKYPENHSDLDYLKFCYENYSQLASPDDTREQIKSKLDGALASESRVYFWLLVTPPLVVGAHISIMAIFF